MCGLTFSFSDAQPSRDIASRVATATQQLRHRGPDAGDVIMGAHWAMGHRRLSIIDLEQSRQPMRDPLQRYALAYNGEIYNYAEQRRKLSGRWDFRTSGDTELLLAGLILEGRRFLERLEGMWAFALWDDVRQELLFGRDRFGKKPLYFDAGSSHCHIASELPAMHTLREHKPEEDEHATADYFRFGFCLPGHTAFKEIHDLLPGHTASWSRDSGLKQTPYWEPGPALPVHSPPSMEEFRDILFNAVKRRLVADVEVGAFLSGGVDSSLVATIAAKHMDRPIKTFSIGFSEASFDERIYARQIARRIGSDHHEIELDEIEPQSLDKLLGEHMGQPFADPSLLPMAMISKLAASHVKVALSGDGADELFSGYQRYQARLMLTLYSRLPQSIRKVLSATIRLFDEPLTHHSRSLLKKAHLFIRSEERFRQNSAYVAPETFDGGMFKELFPHLPAGYDSRCPSHSEADDPVRAMMRTDLLNYLPQDILAKVDRASMAFSLECRAPFLDSDLSAAALAISRSRHRRGFSGKRILGEACRDLLPEAIWKRRKQGFSVPVGHWFRGKLHDQFRELLHDIPHPIDVKAAEQLLSEHKAGRIDAGLALWSMHVYLSWKKNLDG